MNDKQAKKCAAKERHKTEMSARMAAWNWLRQRAARKTGNKGPLWPYLCPVCGFFHLTRSAQAGSLPVTSESVGV